MLELFSQKGTHLQIQALLGSKVWQAIFGGCVYKVSNGTLIITPTELTAKQIARGYHTLLESHFGVPVTVVVKTKRIQGAPLSDNKPLPEKKAVL